MAAAEGRKPARDKSLADDVVDRMQRVWGDSPFYQAQLRGPAPDRIAFHAADPYAPDTAIAQSLIAGRLVIGPENFDFEREYDRLWARAGRSAALFDFLHRFEWLRHLSALGEKGRPAALSLARTWFGANERWSPESWEPYATGERLINLVAHGAFILSAGEPTWKSRVLNSMARQTRHLAISGHRADGGYERLMASMALSVAGLSLPGCESAAEKGLEQLRREIRLQIRPDGGHVSRNPSRQLLIVTRLQMILAALAARKMEAPGFLKHVSVRAAGHLQLFRSGDGRLAVFNGGYEDDARALSAAFAAAEDPVEPTGFARHSGFQRLEAGRSALICDVGAAATPFHGAASFHFSSGRARMFVNCGSGAHLSPDWAGALRQAAAHSTLSSDPAAALAQFIREAQSQHRRAEDVRGHLLEVDRFFGEGPEAPRHLRRFFLSPTGDDLRGEDRLSGFPEDTAAAMVLRFHLHPSVKASLARDGRSAILALSNREGWRFRCDAAAMTIEKSIYCGDAASPNATEQIVIRADGFDGAPSRDMLVKWAVKRMETA
jgi:uncharacterized heparinase superfamily protein